MNQQNPEAFDFTNPADEATMLAAIVPLITHVTCGNCAYKTPVDAHDLSRLAAKPNSALDEAECGSCLTLGHYAIVSKTPVFGIVNIDADYRHPWTEDFTYPVDDDLISYLMNPAT